MFWIHPINMKRDAFGTFKHLFPDLLNDPRKCYNYFRMSIERFYELENMLRHIFHVYFSLELSVSRHPYYNSMLQMKQNKARVNYVQDARRLTRNSTG
jgi:hypothetical protein